MANNLYILWVYEPESMTAPLHWIYSRLWQQQLCFSGLRCFTSTTTWGPTFNGKYQGLIVQHFHHRNGGQVYSSGNKTTGARMKELMSPRGNKAKQVAGTWKWGRTTLFTKCKSISFILIFSIYFYCCKILGQRQYISRSIMATRNPWCPWFISHLCYQPNRRRWASDALYLSSPVFQHRSLNIISVLQSCKDYWEKQLHLKSYQQKGNTVLPLHFSPSLWQVGINTDPPYRQF